MPEHVLLTGVPGIFYRRPTPDEPPFVNEGDEISVGETLGLVEIMKSFHPIASDVSGRVVRFLVENNDEVVPGQEIAVVRTHE